MARKNPWTGISKVYALLYTACPVSRNEIILRSPIRSLAQDSYRYADALLCELRACIDYAACGRQSIPALTQSSPPIWTDLDNALAKTNFSSSSVYKLNSIRTWKAYENRAPSREERPYLYLNH
jgi:hypothetical protein